MLSFYWENDFSLGFQHFNFFHSALELEMVSKQARKSPLGKRPQSLILLQGRPDRGGYHSTLCGSDRDRLSRPLPSGHIPRGNPPGVQISTLLWPHYRAPGSASHSPKTMFSSFFGYSYSIVFGLPAPWWRARGHLDFCFKSCEIDQYLQKQLLGLFFAGHSLDQIVHLQWKSKAVIFFSQLFCLTPSLCKFVLLNFCPWITLTFLMPWGFSSIRMFSFASLPFSISYTFFFFGAPSSNKLSQPQKWLHDHISAFFKSKNSMFPTSTYFASLTSSFIYMCTFFGSVLWLLKWQIAETQLKVAKIDTRTHWVTELKCSKGSK